MVQSRRALVCTGLAPMPQRSIAAAAQLVQLADELRDLAKQLSALSAMPPDAIPGASSKPKRVRKSEDKA